MSLPVSWILLWSDLCRLKTVLLDVFIIYCRKDNYFVITRGGGKLFFDATNDSIHAIFCNCRMQ